jgi:type VI secretion system secreted protein Hcp
MQNMYLEIKSPDVAGESTSSQGTGLIEVLSYSHGVSMPLTFGASNTSRAHGRCQHQDFTISKYVDLASPTLNILACGGDDIKSVTLHVYKADANSTTPIEYLTYTLESVIVTSVAVGGSGGDAPTETVTFNYQKMTWAYIKQGPSAGGTNKGTASTIWDLTKNAKG